MTPLFAHSTRRAATSPSGPPSSVQIDGLQPRRLHTRRDGRLSSAAAEQRPVALKFQVLPQPRGRVARGLGRKKVSRVVHSVADLDDEVAAWLREAYRVGEQKHLGGGPNGG
jgi:hypothetical protein